MHIPSSFGTASPVRLSAKFCLLQLLTHVRHAQVLKDDRVLLIVDDRRDNLSIHLETLFTIGQGITRARRTVHRDKIGRDGILVAYDESKRLLALCTQTKVVETLFSLLHIRTDV